MWIMEGTENVIKIEFGKWNPNISEKDGISKKVVDTLNMPSILHGWEIFIDKNILSTKNEYIRKFFEVFKTVQHIDIHTSENQLTQKSCLTCGDINGVIYTIWMHDFVSVLSHNEELSHLDGMILEDILQLFFEKQWKKIYIEYFSPPDFLNKTYTMNLPIMDHLYDPIFVWGNYFYSIQTLWKDDVDIIRVSPEAVLDSDFKDHDLLLMITYYLEQIYGDSLREYDDNTPVNIIKYDYKNSTTYIETIALGDLIGFCITEIRDRNPLIQWNDIKKIFTSYLDRNTIKEQNADIIPLGK